MWCFFRVESKLIGYTNGAIVSSDTVATSDAIDSDIVRIASNLIAFFIVAFLRILYNIQISPTLRLWSCR